MKALSSLSEVAAQLRAKKTLGQNFLLHQGLCDHIAHALTSNAHVLEIGPGPGGLTRAILAQGKYVTALDLDQRMIDALAPLQQNYPAHLSLRQSNALELPLHEFSQKISIVGNLPFNISTQLLLRWLPQSSMISEMVLMFQAEVAARILAVPRTKSYGRLSVLAQHMMEITPHCTVSAQSFTPPPKVDATVLHFRPQPDIEDRLRILSLLDRVVKLCFTSRRKTLARNLKGKIRSYQTILEQAEISSKARAEELSVADFVRLSRVINPHEMAI